MEILGYRETKDYRYGNNDIYYLALLRAITHDFNLCTQEIEKAKWVSYDEFFNTFNST
jgi:isopentenyldiphosphate isomerase